MYNLSNVIEIKHGNECFVCIYFKKNTMFANTIIRDSHLFQVLKWTYSFVNTIYTNWWTVEKLKANRLFIIYIRKRIDLFINNKSCTA